MTNLDKALEIGIDYALTASNKTDIIEVSWIMTQDQLDAEGITLTDEEMDIVEKAIVKEVEES